jgi:hypothetical protein
MSSPHTTSSHASPGPCANASHAKNDAAIARLFLPLCLTRLGTMRRLAAVCGAPPSFYEPETRGLLELAHDAIARCRAEATTNHRIGFVRALSLRRAPIVQLWALSIARASTARIMGISPAHSADPTASSLVATGREQSLHSTPAASLPSGFALLTVPTPAAVRVCSAPCDPVEGA